MIQPVIDLLTQVVIVIAFPKELCAPVAPSSAVIAVRGSVSVGMHRYVRELRWLVPVLIGRVDSISQ